MKDCNQIVDCVGRREFLVKSAFIAGGLVLTLSGAGSVLGGAFEDLTVRIDEKSPLNKIGGSTSVKSSAGEIIIVRTGDASFVAVSAKCTHKGGPLEYDADTKQFVCDWHGSKFGTDGSNVSGPAKKPIGAYPATGSSTSVTVKITS